MTNSPQGPENSRRRNARLSQWRGRLRSPLRFSHEMKHEKPRDDATPRRIMTVAEIAEYLKVQRVTVHRWARKGKIPAFKIGTDWRFDRDAIEKMMIDRQVKPLAL